jgi:phosphate transport system permease protein
MSAPAFPPTTHAVPASQRFPLPASRGSRWVGLGDRLYGGVITTCALAIPLLLVMVAAIIARSAWPAVSSVGADLVTGTTWDVPRGQFGAFPAILGTLASSLLSLVIATPLAIGVAIFVSELAPPAIRRPFAFLVDVLAAIPSVVYGLWALYVLVPLLREHVMPFLGDTLGLRALPLFAGPAYGPSLLAASLVLAIMILPYIAAVAREVLQAVPRSQREAALALGATRWEMIRDAVLPYARTGLVGATILGLGRALGETMAVTMVIGNRHELPTSLFQPAYTMASLLANEFAEASGELHLSALMAVAGILLAITLVVNAIARWLVWRMEARA